MILIKDSSDLHIRVDIYFYLLLLQTEGNINNYFFMFLFRVLPLKNVCFGVATLSCLKLKQK